ncbi:MAG: cobaltochelatase subunit CobN [Halobacteriota archaeon]
MEWSNLIRWYNLNSRKSCNTTISYAELGNKSNSEKKIALIYFNHPPGKHDVGASYFNLFPSLENALRQMNETGYQCEAWNKTEIKEKIMNGGLNIGVWAPEELDKMVKRSDVVLLPVETYENWFDELPDKIKEEVKATWGPPPGELMVYENNIVIPIIRNGNLIMGPQPNRGWEADIERTYHSLTIPPPHNYIAYYLWLKKDFEADAIVQWGRHGTHEWLPGKMVGLSKDCYPDILIQDIPNIYPYIIDGSGEGIQAKRRGYATLISHLTPPLAQTELYGDLQVLKDLIFEYERSEELNLTSKMEILRGELISTAQNLSIDKDLNLTLTNETFEDDVEELIEYLEELSRESMPYGTHTFGNPPSGDKKKMFLMSMLIAHCKLYETSAAMLGYNWSEINEDKLNVIDNVTNAERIDRTRNLSKFIVNESIIGKDLSSIIGDISTNFTDVSVNDDINSSLGYIFSNGTEWSRALDNTTLELENCLDALNGNYIEPSPEGDPVRNTDVLPTGRNYYGFNTKKIPTKASWEMGKKLADDLITDYYVTHNNTFPEKVGAVMWSVETLRHYGVTEAMVLRLFGLEPKYTGSGDVRNDEVLVTNLTDLTIGINGTTIQRPRMDVVITTSGLYRDTLSYQVHLFCTALETVANLNESDDENYMIRNSRIIKEGLIQLNDSVKEELLNEYKKSEPEFNGTFEDFADMFSKLRVFAPPPGEYGTGIDKVIHAGSTSWNASNADKAVGDAYIFRMANMYLCGTKYLGNYGEVFRENLNGTDVIFNSRSTNLYGVLDNDDFFQYVGGFAIAVRSITGKTPEIAVVNLRNMEKPKIESLATFLAKELRTRLFNPTYLEGMRESEYSGLREIADFAENLYGWQVTVPDVVRPDMWNEIYNTIIQDKYNLGLKDAFDKDSPHAYQSIVARMLEATRKEYWNPSDDVKTALAETYQKSVDEYGVTCCGHTCGNPFINDYVSGILSAPVKAAPSGEEQSTQISRRGGGGGRRIEEEIGLVNETAELSGVSKVGEEFKKPPEETGETAEKVKKGRVMKEEEPASTLPVSGAPLMGLIVVIVMLVFVGVGFWLKARKR